MALRTDYLIMAQSKKTQLHESVRDSVKQSTGFTAGRTRSEKRIGSGNVRAGSAQAQKEAAKVKGRRTKRR